MAYIKIKMHLLLICLIVGVSEADDVVKETEPQESMHDIEKSIPRQEIRDGAGIDIANAIERIEVIAASAEKSKREKMLPEEDLEKLYAEMAGTLADLIEIVKNRQNTYKFLNTKGVDRIIAPIIGVNYDPLKKQFLMLIKTLFEVTPTTTKALMPVSVIDKLLDIFEHDDNLALKAHALDVMHVWLPDNPKLQARVMRLKGLEPFYHQVSKLDSSVVEKLLDLFNKILKEHVNARKKANKTKDDIEKRKLYEMIGLVERMSTPNVCNGLLNIIESVSLLNIDDPFSSSIVELMKNIKPFCLKLYKGKVKAIKIFENLVNYVSDRKVSDDNVSDLRVLLDDYLKHMKLQVRDEF